MYDVGVDPIPARDIAETARIDPVYRIAVGIGIWFVRLVDKRIDGQELPGCRVVVAPNSLADCRPPLG
jgi:hypothetical protein